MLESTVIDQQVKEPKVSSDLETDEAESFVTVTNRKNEKKRR